MRMTRLVLNSIAIGSMTLSIYGVHGQQFPSKPIRIVTAGSGGTADFTARILAQGLTANLGQQVIVDNRANGTIPGEIVAKSSPDGYTLLITGNSLWVGKLMHDNASYDAFTDFTPVVLVTNVLNLVVINPNVPATNLRELIAYGKARPGQLNYGTGATGSASHLSAELFKSMAGLTMMRIPYKSNSAQITDLLSGQIQIMFTNQAAAGPHVRTGRLRALAVTSGHASTLFPELPTVGQTLPGYESVVTNALFAPAHTPPALSQRLYRETLAALARPEIKEKFASAGVEEVGATPKQLLDIMHAEMGRLDKVIREGGIRTE